MESMHLNYWLIIRESTYLNYSSKNESKAVGEMKNSKSENGVDQPNLNFFYGKFCVWDVINNIQNEIYKLWLTFENIFGSRKLSLHI
jgi:hypothetical protein